MRPIRCQARARDRLPTARPKGLRLRVKFDLAKSMIYHHFQYKLIYHDMLTHMISFLKQEMFETFICIICINVYAAPADDVLVCLQSDGKKRTSPGQRASIGELLANVPSSSPAFMRMGRTQRNWFFMSKSFGPNQPDT